MALVTVQRSPTPSTTSSPCVSEAGSAEDDRRSQPRSISENFLTVKGAALFLPRGNGSSPSSAPRITQRRNKHTGDLQQHLQTMFTLLRPEDTIRLAVRLESAYALRTRYMVIVSTNGRQDTEESVVLGMDFGNSDSTCTVGLVLPLWSDTLIHLDGDGGFSVSTVNRVHVFKPVSVQAMWSALQSLHKVCEVARCHNYYPGSLFLTWVSYYQSRVTSDQHCINEWNAMQDVQSHRADSPVLFTDLPTERERTERLIKTRLREIMMQKDLENVTSKEIRTELEMQMVCNLREFKEFIDNEMIVILGQMDSPTEIFDHVYLGSEWNASNLEELQNSGVRYILNVTREIDNFFPGLFEYHNIRVYDEEATNLLEYWNDTYKFISKAKKAGVKCLVHCKMGVSRSASTVIAYAMKEYSWDLERAFDHVKERRSVTKPNPSFMKQLEEYQGILLASKQRHNKLWRSHSDSDLSEAHEPLCKAPRSLDHSDTHNNNGPPSIQQMLGIAVIESLTNPQSATGNTHTKLGESPSKLAHEDPILPPLSQTLELCLESAASKDEGNQPSPSMPEVDSPSGAPAAPRLDSSDDNNNPNTADLGTADDFVDAGVSCLSTDSIDFFSAREKFLCLSQDSQPARSFSETTAVWSPQSRCSPPLDDSSEEGDEVRVGHHFRDNCTSRFDLQKIQETLRELQAFLYEAGGLGLCTGQVEENQSPEDKQDLIDGEQRLEHKAPAMWKRAMEIEARIRQAGLTPPSLMKRSASIAKLDRLELSTNDLSDWDFHPATTGFHQPSSSSLSTSDTLPLTHSHDDAHKKQRVLPQSPSAPDSAVQAGSAHLPPSCPHQTQVGGASPPEHTPVQPTVSVSTRQQHVKTHPVRRFRKALDKKKTVTVLYNTM
uniref:protein-serine/threonine phosphatase n=1 Tax=Cyprinus carpio TaxID=7962 RepID=A0A8C1LHS6_CYPCA